MINSFRQSRPERRTAEEVELDFLKRQKEEAEAELMRETLHPNVFRELDDHLSRVVFLIRRTAMGYEMTASRFLKAKTVRSIIRKHAFEAMGRNRYGVRLRNMPQLYIGYNKEKKRKEIRIKTGPGKSNWIPALADARFDPFEKSIEDLKNEVITRGKKTWGTMMAKKNKIIEFGRTAEFRQLIDQCRSINTNSRDSVQNRLQMAKKFFVLEQIDQRLEEIV